MTLIGIEEHFLTAEIREAWNAIGLDAVDPSVAFHSGPIEALRGQDTHGFISAPKLRYVYPVPVKQSKKVAIVRMRARLRWDGQA
jgi:hypothetical protein